ncbi:ParB/RepB/Spo0J family partition protein [[Eubacterium] hominis]|uniref:ParB/RepB/Spo0J family partition protein n=1 Tax=[Eubacterium] hominis TaxID=2764325 RepID=UPI003A4E44CE
MPRKTLSDMQIPDLDEDILFKSEKTKREEKEEKIIDIKIKDISDFPNHPFKVKEDREMFELADSITKHGVSIPAIVRPKSDGGYEMIAGHRRKLGCILAEKETIPCIVRQMSDDEATILMTDTNLRQREKILPSEKAFAYKMRLEAMNAQGNRTDLTSAPLGPKLRSNEKLAEEVEESVAQIKRYVRLTDLIEPILDMVDENLIALRPAVEISYLSKENQQCLLEYMQCNECTPSHAQTIKMHKLEKDGLLSTKDLEAIMQEEKPNQVEKIKIPKNRIRNFFSNKTSEKEIEDTIVKALELYQRYQQRKKAERDSR